MTIVDYQLSAKPRAAGILGSSMDQLIDDTIAAPASAPGSAFRGIIRISGSDTKSVCEELFRPDHVEQWKTAKLPFLHAGRLKLTSVGSSLLPATIHFWPTHRSFTTQPTAEIHTIGSPPLMDAILCALYKNGARPARRGEFTLRAFLAGRLDLMQAEAVLGVIDATEQQELNRALEQLAGGISGRIAGVHRDLLDLLSDLEAGLDFVEEDIEFISQDDIMRRLDDALLIIGEMAASANDRMESTGRRQVVIAGLPNAGKSTLFNALAGRDAALVSNIVGTTRDYVRADVEWDGQRLELIDTAGWESAAEGISQAAGQLRDESIQRADVVLWCRPAHLPLDSGEIDARLYQRVENSGSVILVETKSDLGLTTESTTLSVCAQTGAGIDDLRAELLRSVAGPTFDAAGLIGTTAARCRNCLFAACDAVQSALDTLQSGIGDEVVANEIRNALNHLGEIVGTVYTDDILDRIFSKFCIGK